MSVETSFSSSVAAAMAEQNDIMAWTPRDEEERKEDLYDSVFQSQVQVQAQPLPLPQPQDQTNLDMNTNMNMNMMPWIPKNEDDIRKFIYDYQISDEMQVPMQTTSSGMNFNGGHDYGHYRDRDRDHDHDHDSLMENTPNPTPIVRPFILPNRARSPSKMPGPALELGMGMGMGCLGSVPASVPASASGSNSHLSGVPVRNGIDRAEIDRIDDFLRTCTISERPELNGSVGSEPRRLGSVNLTCLSNNDLVFAFGVVSIMAALRPRFVFKFGGREGAKVGARFTLYGHTIVVKPLCPSLQAAKVMGYRLALIELKKFNPDWLFPPLPIDGPTGLEWNWTRLLDDYLTESGRPICRYVPTAFSDGQWHCEVQAAGESFHTIQKCSSVPEAQNVVGHLALYAILVADGLNENQIILPVTSPLLPEIRTDAQVRAYQDEKRKKRTIQEDVSTLRRELSSPDESNLHNGVPDGLRRTRGAGNRVNKNVNKVVSNHDRVSLPLGPSSGNKKKKKKNKQGKQPAHSINPSALSQVGDQDAPGVKNANLVPLEKRRLVDIEIKEVVEDKLATLKSVRDKLTNLGRNASCESLVREICETINASFPNFTYEPNPNPSSSSSLSSHAIFAHFDSRNPYLLRASPIFLAAFPSGMEGRFRSKGLKGLILYLLVMIRDDAGLELDDREYRLSFRVLRDIEIEMEGLVKSEV